MQVKPRCALPESGRGLIITTVVIVAVAVAVTLPLPPSPLLVSAHVPLIISAKTTVVAISVAAGSNHLRQYFVRFSSYIRTILNSKAAARYQRRRFHGRYKITINRTWSCAAVS